MEDKRAKNKKTRKSAGPKKKANAKARKKKRSKPKSSGGLVNYSHMHALSKQLRVEILAILCERIASPKELSVELDQGLSQVNYHIHILRKAGLIVLDHKAQRRGAIEHFYRAAEPTLVPRGAWDGLPPAVREKVISSDILRELFADLSASLRAGIFDRPPNELSHTPLLLDEDGGKELEQLCDGFLDSLTELQARVDKRLAKGDSEATDAAVFLAAFPSARDPERGRKASARRRR